MPRAEQGWTSTCRQGVNSGWDRVGPAAGWGQIRAIEDLLGGRGAGEGENLSLESGMCRKVMQLPLLHSLPDGFSEGW